MTGLFPDIQRGALFSDCRKWRFSLWRFWGDGAPLVVIGLNPSTADELYNDPTVERCQRRAQAMGLSGLVMLNLFAYRATDPRDMKAQADPIGPGNDWSLRTWSRLGPVLCGWGNHGAHLDRGAKVRAMLKVPLYKLKLTNGGQPQHPLYVSYSIEPSLWEVLHG